MSELDRRLAECFAIAFPGLSADEARDASPKSVEAWDSIGAMNLSSVISEEFGIEIDLERLPDLQSFDAFRRLVEGQLTGRRAAGQDG
jgi:acyl carrier protein